MQNIIVCLIASLFFGSIISIFLKTAFEKKGQDFSFKELVKKVSLKNIDVKYILIYFISLYCLTSSLGLKDTIICIPFCFAMVLAFILDSVYMIIPDTSCAVIFACGIVKCIVDFSKESFISSILGFIIGGITFWIINYFCEKLTKKTGFGMGDIKLLASLGLFFGLKGIIVVMLLSIGISAIFSIIFLIYKAAKKKNGEYIPFGPFIVISSFIVYIVSYEKIIQLYYSLVDKILTKI